jgi:hypothetical protein
MVTGEWWIEKDVERNNQGIILTWNLPGVGIAGPWAKIWTQDLPNMKQEC